MQQTSQHLIGANDVNSDQLNEIIISYFQPFFKHGTEHRDARLVDLGFESIDFIGLAAFLLKTANKWLDISKVNNNTKISDLVSYLVEPIVETPQFKNLVEFDKAQYYVYGHELNDDYVGQATAIMHLLHLKQPIDLPKLKKAISDTLNNHFILNSKIVCRTGEHYFDRASPQESVEFQGSYFFPKKDLTHLKVKAHYDRLVNIYIQTKKGQHYLIISYHHIALDGWSYILVQEEIFRRYAGIYALPKKSLSADIKALNSIYPSSMNQTSVSTELEALFEAIDPSEYNHLDHLFRGQIVSDYSCFTIPKKVLDNYCSAQNIQGVAHSSTFIFLLYQILREIARVNKLLFYLNNSNRYLPIEGITHLAGNFVTGFPILLDITHLTSEQLIELIDQHLKIYFKHMSYGAITRMLLEKQTALNTCFSRFRNPYNILLTYINNISKLVYGTDHITSNYVHWNTSETHIWHAKQIFLDVHNMGDEFLIQLHTGMIKGGHARIIEAFKARFPCLASQI